MTRIQPISTYCTVLQMEVRSMIRNPIMCGRKFLKKAEDIMLAHCDYILSFLIYAVDQPMCYVQGNDVIIYIDKSNIANIFDNESIDLLALATNTNKEGWMHG